MDAEPQNKNADTLLATDDEHVMQYLSGAIIKWGVKIFSGSKTE